MAVYKPSFGISWTVGVKFALTLGILSAYCALSVWAEPEAPTTPSENKSSVEAYKKSSASTVTQAIQLYREKNYVEADRLFTQLHAENPDKTKTTYYLAITKAQEGDFLEASRLYQEVIQHESGSPLGLLAQQGLKNIPLTATANVDAPPQFPNFYSGDASPYTPNASPMGAGGMQGVSPNDLMWMQTMMGTNNNNGNNNNSNNNDWGSWMAGIDANNNAMSGMNGAMSLPGMQMPNMMPGGNMPMMNNGKPMDPQVMSSWLSNQMMQNSTMFMNDDNDKH